MNGYTVTLGMTEIGNREAVKPQGLTMTVSRTSRWAILRISKIRMPNW